MDDQVDEANILPFDSSRDKEGIVSGDDDKAFSHYLVNGTQSIGSMLEAKFLTVDELNHRIFKAESKDRKKILLKIKYEVEKMHLHEPQHKPSYIIIDVMQDLYDSYKCWRIKTKTKKYEQ